MCEASLNCVLPIYCMRCFDLCSKAYSCTCIRVQYLVYMSASFTLCINIQYVRMFYVFVVDVYMMHTKKC